jgi:hypothetical protein
MPAICIPKQMDTYTSQLASRLAGARKIQPKTVKGYVTNLRVIRGIVDPDVENPLWFTQYAKIFDVIAPSPPSTRLTRLNALVILSELESDGVSRSVYSKRHAAERVDYNAWVKTQTKTASQAKRWATPAELMAVRDKLLKRAAELFPQKSLTSAEFTEYQNSVAYALYLAHPIRNEFGGMTMIALDDFEELSQDTKETQNYYVYSLRESFIHLAHYKTSKTYGIKQIVLEPDTHKIMLRWLNINPIDSLFVQKKRGSLNLSPMNSMNFGKLIARISKANLGKNTGTNDIRHILVSQSREGRPTIQDEKDEEEAIQNRFLHSRQTNRDYRKVS